MIVSGPCTTAQTCLLHGRYSLKSKNLDDKNSWEKQQLAERPYVIRTKFHSHPPRGGVDRQSLENWILQLYPNSLGKRP